MKKILSLILCVLMMVSACALAGCGAEEAAEEAATLKFGVGAVSSLTTAEATDKAAASGTLDMAYATVLVDADGKIVACKLDAMNMKTSFADGKVTAVEDKALKSKYEQKDAYSMMNYTTGATTTWVQNADALEKMIVGKTLDEVKALVAADGKGVEAVQNAGCSITITELVKAVEAAYNNAKTEVAKDAKLSIAGYGKQEIKDAEGENLAQNKLEAYMTAAALDKDGKILAIQSDCMNGNFRLNAEGKVETFDCNAAQTKRQQGDAYMMKNYDTGRESTWVQNADAFDAKCIGKKAAEITGLMGADYKGVADVQSAGCTIYVSGLVAAAAKL